jgi:hypothetical protein
MPRADTPIPDIAQSMDVTIVPLGRGAPPLRANLSPHSFSDHLVLARQLLLGSAAVYLAVFLLFRMLRALIAAPRHEGTRRGFDVNATDGNPLKDWTQ